MSPTSLGPVKQIDAGVLNTGYVEAGLAGQITHRAGQERPLRADPCKIGW